MISLTEMNRPDMDDTEFFQRQLEMREAELNETLYILQSIANGNGQGIFRSSCRGEGADLENWKDKLDLNKLIIAGHSFGATTAVRIHDII
jgi:platelet-activating factor acetylhydrolase